MRCRAVAVTPTGPCRVLAFPAVDRTGDSDPAGSTHRQKWLDTGELATGTATRCSGSKASSTWDRAVRWRIPVRQRRAVRSPSLIFGGCYVYVAYLLTGEHVPWERESGTIGG